MNKAIIAKQIRRPPGTSEKAYIFLSDNKAICEAIVTVGFLSLYVAPSGEQFFTEDSFCEFVRDTVHMGTEIASYVFVLACFRKKTNDALEKVLKNNQLSYRIGAYTLFKDKAESHPQSWGYPVPG